MLLHEVHRVAGAKEDAFDDAYRDQYLPALAKIKHPGITADIQFDKNGDLTKGLLTIFQVKNGKWEVVSN